MMLKSITLKNLATISDTALEFQEGLNVLTGETGSGKSILVDGLMLATGRRADRSMVRPGTRNAFVEAVFLDHDQKETVVRREISLEGRSRTFIDDSLSTLDEVRTAVQHFVELHSQRSTPALLRSSTQLGILDRFASVLGIREAYAGKYADLRRMLLEREELRDYLDSSGRNREILLHEQELFHQLRPSAEDYTSLLERETELRRALEHSVLYADAFEALSGDGGLISTLCGIQSRVGRESPDSTALTELLEQASIALKEAAGLLGEKLETGEEAPGLMAGIEERLDGYSRLMSRFGGTIDEALKAGESLQRRLREYDEAVDRAENLEDACAALSRELGSIAGELSRKRREAGELLAGKVVEGVQKLNMPWAGFSVDFRDVSEGIEIDGRKLGPAGSDRITFMFTANAGIPMEPLDSVASGGELSRVALALAIALADSGTASTLIFDEIDSGTGGETAHLLAESLLRAAESRQIIVVSHLAQIASRAHRHLAVEKNFEDGMPVTTVKHLDDTKDRVEELSRLLGGGDGAEDHARKLLEEGS